MNRHVGETVQECEEMLTQSSALPGPCFVFNCEGSEAPEEDSSGSALDSTRESHPLCRSGLA